jgi:hypothetical protein
MASAFMERYENTFSATAIAILHMIFYRSQTVEKLTDVLAGLLVAGEDLAFIKERFSPTVREAILQQNINTGPLDRLQLLLQFTGLMTKMVRARQTYWPRKYFVMQALNGIIAVKSDLGILLAGRHYCWRSFNSTLGQYFGFGGHPLGQCTVKRHDWIRSKQRSCSATI